MRAQLEKGGLRCGSNSKKGGLRCGSGQKRGVFTAAHTYTEHICEYPPPGPTCGIRHYSQIIDKCEPCRVPRVGTAVLTHPILYNFIPFVWGVHDFTHSLYIYIYTTEYVSVMTMFTD